MRRTLLRLHRLVSLAALGLWGLQAVTGLALVFRVELDNALTPGAAAPLDPPAMARSLKALAPSLPAPVDSLTVADRGATRYDLYAADDTRLARVTGRGELVATRDQLRAAAWLDKLKSFHESLWAGDLGTAILGGSGVLLLTNLALALRLAWPAAGTLGRVLALRGPADTPAGAFQWHRAVGLWGVAPAAVLVSAGVLLALGDPLAGQLGADRPPPAPRPAAAPAAVAFEQAIALGLARYPGSRVSVVNLPNAERPWYRLRLRQPGELQRFYGGTEVFFDAGAGTLLAAYDGRRPTMARGLFDGFYPVHTLEFLGAAGRAVAAGVGLWLLAMIVLGVRLWRMRRKGRTAT